MKRPSIFSNTIINIANTIFGFVIAFIMTPIVLERLGTQDYGIWSFLGIFSITGYFSLLDFGFQGATIKYVAEFYGKNDRERLQSVVNSALFFFLLAGLLGAVALIIFNTFFFARFFNIPADELHIVSILVNLIAVSFIFQFPTMAYSAFIEGLQRYDYHRAVNFITVILSNLAIYFFVTKEHGLYWMVGISLATSLCTTILFILITRRILPYIRLSIRSIHIDIFRLLFSLSSKLFVTKIVGLIFNNTDKIMIGIFLTVNHQTDYDIVNKIHLVVLSILSIMNQAILPAASDFSSRDDSQSIKSLLFYGTKYAAALVIPVFFLFLILPKEFLNIWVGEQFTSLSGLVQLYLIHFIFTMFVGVSSTMMVGVNRVGEVLKISIFAAVLNLGISLFTVRHLGITGLILGTTVSNAFSSLLYVFISNKILHVRNREFFSRVILPLFPSTLILLAFFFLAKRFFDFSHIIEMLILAIVAYSVFLLLFYVTALDDYEKNLFKSFIRNL